MFLFFHSSRKKTKGESPQIYKEKIFYRLIYANTLKQFYCFVLVKKEKNRNVVIFIELCCCLSVAFKNWEILINTQKRSKHTRVETIFLIRVIIIRNYSLVQRRDNDIIMDGEGSHYLRLITSCHSLFFPISYSVITSLGYRCCEDSPSSVSD